MITRKISLNRWISIVLVAMFMIFASPTPISESHANESARPMITQGIEYQAKPTARKRFAAFESMHATAASFMLVSLLCAMFTDTWRILSAAIRSSLRPQIARRLAYLRLLPIKRTSLYASASFLS